MVIGDDDALCPFSLDRVGKILDKTQAKILSGNTHTYYWDNCLWVGFENRLFTYIDKCIKYSFNSSRDVLKKYYSDLQSHCLPMIYTSFVHHSVIKAVIKKYGKYFVINNAPDVVSGIVNCCFVESILNAPYPFLVRGISGSSNGAAHILGGSKLGRDIREAFKTEEKTIFHKDMIETTNLHLSLININLLCKDLLFSNDQELRVDMKKIVINLLMNLNSHLNPDAYEQNLKDAQALATKHGLTITEIPPKIDIAKEIQRNKRVGPITNGFWLDTKIAGIKDVYGASMLAESFYPRDFSKDPDGLLSLGLGKLRASR